MRPMLSFIVALGLLSSSSVAQFRLQDSPPPTPKLIKAGRILDVTSGKHILNRGSLTEHERIKEVGPWEASPESRSQGRDHARTRPGDRTARTHRLSLPSVSTSDNH